MNVEVIETRFQLLEAQVKEEREARLGLEEKNLSLEEQLKKQANNRETDLLRFTTTNNQLKAQLKATQQALEVKSNRKQRKGTSRRSSGSRHWKRKSNRKQGKRKAGDPALEQKIQHEERQRKEGDLALLRNEGLPRDYSKVSDKPVIRFGSYGAGDGQFNNPFLLRAI